ncbi:MAG: transporter [Gemmatimonadota bacterium]
MRRLLLQFTAIATLASAVGAQQAKPDTAKKAAPPIADNSFLMEEAYNQEFGVVQHISVFQRTKEGSWAYAFTQEWPSPSQKHQISYTIPILRPDGGSAGVGDVALNYRYQLLGAEEEPLWFSPRVSLYAPTGDVKQGRGAGGPAIELAFPVSYALSDAFVTHWNAGGSLTRADNGFGKTATTRSIKGGVSGIWLLAPTFNVMVEAVASRFQFLTPTGARAEGTSYVISPGVRGAINFASGLQVVPGIAFPIGVGKSSGQRDLLLYLSFEHPFRTDPSAH